jgi:cholesterol transport system auxiliary component
LALVAAGCSVLPPARVDEPVLHVLDAAPAVNVAQGKRDLVLEVSSPRASPGFDSSAMAYVQKRFALDYFAVHRWADSPARMIGPLLTRALEQTGRFRAVVQPSTGIPADLRLDTELVRLQQNFIARPSQVELALRLQLIDVRARRIVATRVIAVTRQAPTDDPDGGVIAANAALASALEQSAEFCVDASANVSPATTAGP